MYMLSFSMITPVKNFEPNSKLQIFTHAQTEVRRGKAGLQYSSNNYVLKYNICLGYSALDTGLSCTKKWVWYIYDWDTGSLILM